MRLTRTSKRRLAGRPARACDHRPQHNDRPPDYRASHRSSFRQASCRDTALRTRASTTNCPATQPTECNTSRTSASQRRWRWVLFALELSTLALLASGATAHAEPDKGPVVLAIAGSVEEVLTNIRNWLMGILAGLATVFLTIGGVRRVFGGGDPGEQEKAKEAFKAAGIGYALAALAPLVVTVLKGIVGA